MKTNEIKVPFSAALNDRDTEKQTFGCRANNPDICKWAYVKDVCAFASGDNICKHPSAAWKKQYLKLGGKNNG